MSQPTQNYIDKVVRWAYGQIDLQKMNMRPDQRFRARLALECYHKFMENTAVPVRQMVKRIAARDYALLVKNAAMGIADAQEMVAALGITQDPQTGVVSTRSETNIANDIYVINQLCARLNVSKQHIQKAMYEDNITWLMGFGRKTGNVSAIKEAQRNLEKINNDFRGDEDPQEQMPNTQINITGDVSVVKEGRQSLSDDERKRLMRKYGLTEKEYAQELEEINGVWQAPDEEEEKDIFVENEQQ
jgi:hypothetical protein